MLKFAIISIAAGLAIGLLVFRNKAIGVRIVGGLSFSIVLFGVLITALIMGGDR